MHDPSHCLHRLLLENTVESAIHVLHNNNNYRVPYRASRGSSAISELLVDSAA